MDLNALHDPLVEAEAAPAQLSIKTLLERLKVLSQTDHASRIAGFAGYVKSFIENKKTTEGVKRAALLLLKQLNEIYTIARIIVSQYGSTPPPGWESHIPDFTTRDAEDTLKVIEEYAAPQRLTQLIKNAKKLQQDLMEVNEAVTTKQEISLRVFLDLYRTIVELIIPTRILAEAMARIGALLGFYGRNIHIKDIRDYIESAEFQRMKALQQKKVVAVAEPPVTAAPESRARIIGHSKAKKQEATIVKRLHFLGYSNMQAMQRAAEAAVSELGASASLDDLMGYAIKIMKASH